LDKAGDKKDTKNKSFNSEGTPPPTKRILLEEPEPEILNPNKPELTLEELEEKMANDMNALENSDSNKIFIPKTRVKPKINMEFMMEEGDHHYPGQYPNIL
jgi:hypothetical protein